VGFGWWEEAQGLTGGGNEAGGGWRGVFFGRGGFFGVGGAAGVMDSFWVDSCPWGVGCEVSCPRVPVFGTVGLLVSGMGFFWCFWLPVAVEGGIWGRFDSVFVYDLVKTGGLESWGLGG